MTTTLLAAAGDTWGISGPTFLAGYLTVAALAVVGSVVHRARLFGGDRTSGPEQLDPPQVAYLNGGARLALHSSIGALRHAGAIGMAVPRLAATGPLPAGANPIDQAVYDAASRRVRPRDLAQDHRVSAAVDQLRQDLERRGLAVPASHRRAARLGPALLLALVAVGVLRLVAGLANDQPVGFLFVGVVGLTVVGVAQATRIPHRTHAGRAALRDLRTRYRHLAPSSTPAFSTYGAAGVGMAVALFGTATLWTLDPAFAGEAEIERQATGDTGASAGGAGGDGGSSDGGTGNGGGCGGGCGGCGG
ncbi:TIGR04222 domain-containing membrane protein [Micromonospora sp. WMMD882]|uniref:TIGR04222 domain-containing membrane protein n=1 Tax=Micromonospora sp. WMMD882 TaxID=3015151 RepID=UPI00248B2F83|nr:TIGR04222 domain-containing membrane protein [Micromonospora sp. WMMD882]WBB80165.1 TIGR04222 domain-containing membrane protein [Micromonospora sp. WMMD882]